MKLINAITLLLFLTVLASAQRPMVEKWDRDFGGTNDDNTNSIQQTSDGGYMIGGYSLSRNNGDKTQDNWDTTQSTSDFWMVKTDSLGNKLWDKRFGGTDVEVLWWEQQTNDGGYILAGISFSDSGGDKTQNCWGGQDFWLVKTNALGIKQWDRRFGGVLDDIAYDVIQTRDGGYLMVGTSASPISGDKTQDAYNGSFDGWAVKVDSMGNEQWNKRFGGIDNDCFASAVQCADGGYLIGGFTFSDSGYDISQPPWGAYNPALNNDWWIIKVDSDGSKEWDRRYGTNGLDFLGTILLAPDGGYILAGTAGGGASDTEDLALGMTILKIDSAGNKQWDNGFGPAYSFLGFSGTMDGGYLISTTTMFDSIGGDKTEMSLGRNQTWLLKADSTGHKQWDKTILSNKDNNGIGIESSDGCYVVASTTPDGIGGYKTQPNWNPGDSTFDFWLAKFCFSGIGEGIEAITLALQLSVYPNPFTTELDISLAQQGLTNATFTIYNTVGQTIYNQTERNLSPNYTKMLDLSYLPSGLYLVQVNAGGEVVTREVVKE